ncbi:MAG: 5-(carboxyamino)imidazole ribonucleotide synthase [Candidatus Kinetoplastibacterium crithidii]|nr:MAG: 5-(carboxyamino)imidazole ribonucleotide synthase [Candidatus Kinetoplastibacterium crithidii]
MVLFDYNSFIKPGSWLGLLGGGQLGKMFCNSAQQLGYKVAVIEPSNDSPASSVSDLHLRSSYDDEDALNHFASICKSVTVEFENVPVHSLSFLAKKKVRVCPSYESIAIAQNRILEKEFIGSLGIDLAPYKVLYDYEDCDSISESLFPGILKVAQLGYDGKGQIRVKDKGQLKKAFDDLGKVPSVFEKMLSLDQELSIVVARDFNGNIKEFPPSINFHNLGILSSSIITSVNHEIYSNIDISRVSFIARKIIESLKYSGVLCIEFFIIGNRIIVNEIAPRPHNSGHYSIEACVTSQFEQQVRAMVGLPLGDTSLMSSAIMINLLGDIWFDKSSGLQREPDWMKALNILGAKLHLYGKNEARIGRKMGHITLLGNDVYELNKRAYDLCSIIGIDYESV